MRRALLAPLLLLTACTGPLDSPATPAVRGAALFRELGCVACHATSAEQTEKKLGPLLAGVAGGIVTLEGGRTVTADDAYLRESITQPDAQTVTGFPKGVMAAGMGEAARKLDADTVGALIAYLRTLK